jgi:thiol-disulfide isomerase/thioredoxin
MSQQGLSSGAKTTMRRILLVAIAVLLPLLMALAADAPPPCVLTLSTGQSVNFDQFRGQVLYVDFWASWCGPCLLSFPFMNELQGAYGGKGLHVLAINMDEKPADAARFLDQHKATVDVASGPNGKCAKDFGVATMPTSFLVDRKGAIRLVHKGFRPDDVGELKAKLDELIAEQ